MMNCIKKVCVYLKNNIDAIALFATLFLCDLILRLHCSFGFGKLSLLFNSIHILFLITIYIVIPKKYSKVFGYIAVIFATIYCAFQSVHFDFFGTFFRFKKIAAINELINVRGEITVSSKLFLFLIPIIVYYCFCKISSRDTYEDVMTKGLIVIFNIGLICAGVLCINKHFESENNYKRWFESDEYLRTSFYNESSYVDRFGAYDYAAMDFLSFVNKKKTTISDDKRSEIAKFVDNNRVISSNEKTGLFKGKNLVLVLCESLNNFPINKNITPTLYKMANDGFYFTNYYAPIYQASTSDAGFVINTGMLPSVDYEQTCYAFGDNHYPYSLANLFKKNGYSSNSFHASVGQFYNRFNFHNSLGYEKFYDINTLEIEIPQDFESFVNWIDDDVAFNAMLNLTDTNIPFFNYIITGSGHLPYQFYRHELDVNYSMVVDLESESFENADDFHDETRLYLASQMKLDQGLEQLLADLDNSGSLEDTIIVLFGDHYPYGMNDAPDQKIVWGDYGNDYEVYRTPLIIYDPSSVYGIRNDKLCSSFDVYPTLCNLFDLDSGDSYKVGKDIFGDDRTVVYFADRSILTDEYFYNSASGEVTILNERYADDIFNADIDRMRDVFEYSQIILSEDYYYDLE